MLDRDLGMPICTAPLFGAPPREHVTLPTVFRPEPIKRVTPRRPLDLPDDWVQAHPSMAAALTQAYRLQREFELIE